jgi:hypothetical protein
MLTQPERTLEALIAQHVPFAQIEQYIDELRLASEQSSALWLVAWVHSTNPATRRNAAARALAHLS